GGARGGRSSKKVRSWRAPRTTDQGMRRGMVLSVILVIGDGCGATTSEGLAEVDAAAASIVWGAAPVKPIDDAVVALLYTDAAVCLAGAACAPDLVTGSFSYDHASGGVCSGDSGGPTLIERSGAVFVGGVHAAILAPYLSGTTQADCLNATLGLEMIASAG